MNKSYLLNAVLILISGLFLFSCRNDNNVEIDLELKSDFKIVHQDSKLITDNPAIKNIINNASNSYIFRKYVTKTIKRSYENKSLTIYQDNITYVSKRDGSRESFTFFIENKFKRNKYYLENLVISKSKNQSEYQAHIITYFFPKGYSVDGNDFKIINFKKLELSSVNREEKQSTTTKGSGCTIIYEYTITETKHKCSSGIHSGDGERDVCYENQKPYSTYVMTATPLMFDCGGSGGGATTEGPNNPGGGGSSPGSGGNLSIDTGISLPPPCQTSDCNVVILANEINQLLGLPLKYDELVYLNDNPNIANNIYSQLQSNNNQNFKKYITIKIGLLSKGEDIPWTQFTRIFLTPKVLNDGGDNFDILKYQNQQTQRLPLLKFSLINQYYPRDPKNNIYGMPSEQVYKLVGGNMYSQNITGNPNYANACAIRISRAFNYGGQPVPVFYNDAGKQKSEKGSDGKNYILSAEAMLAYMLKTYPAPAYTYTGNNLTSVYNNIKGKNGIYIIINT